MRIEWDETKSASNQRKHRVSFELASSVFDDPMQLTLQDREVDGEERWQTIGRAEGVILLLVAHTVAEQEDVVRIISARRATANERGQYEGGF